MQQSWRARETRALAIKLINQQGQYSRIQTPVIVLILNKHY